MNCPETRAVLFPEPAKAAATIETAAALDHLRVCPSCGDHFRGYREWRRHLRDATDGEPAPASLQRRVSQLIETNRSRRWRVRLPAALATMVVMALVGVAWFALWLPSKRFFEHVCEDHGRYLEAQSQISGDRPADIESWFRDRANFAVKVPRVEDAQLLGGRLCFLKGRKAALLFYRKRGRPVSYFQFGASGVKLNVLKREMIDGAPLWRMSWNGYSLVAYEQRGVISAFVSDVRESELLQLASAARIGSAQY